MRPVGYPAFGVPAATAPRAKVHSLCGLLCAKPPLTVENRVVVPPDRRADNADCVLLGRKRSLWDPPLPAAS